MVDFNTEAQRHGDGRPMKDSGVAWIGDVPEWWGVGSLLYSLRAPISDGPHETPTLIDDGIPFVSIDSLNDSDQIDFGSVSRFISEDEYLRFSQRTKLEEGDVLFSKAATIGKTAIVGKERFMVWSPLAILKVNKKTLSEKFLYYLVNCVGLIESARLLGSQNTQANVGMRELEKVKIPTPPLPEQRAIAGYLDGACGKIDGLREKVEKQIAALEEYKKSVITEAVTGKVEVRGVGVGEGDGATFEARERDPKTMKPSGVAWIGDVPEGWGVKRFKYVVSSLRKGNGITKDQVFENAELPCVRYGEIYSKYGLAFDQCISRTKSECVPNPVCVNKFDILFACTGELVEEIGKNILYLGDETCVAGGDIIVASHNQDARFLNYYLSSAPSQYQKSRGKLKLKVVHARTSDIENLLVLLPPLPEQKAIAGYLDRKCAAIDGAVAKCKRQLDNLAEYKKSLIYECVTGKREVEV